MRIIADFAIGCYFSIDCRLIIAYNCLMKEPQVYLSELFRIISGALRLDIAKVRNYTSFLADKLEADGDKPSAERIRKLLSDNEQQLHPVNLNVNTVPVDSETRFPLLEDIKLVEFNDSKTILTEDQRNIVDEFINIAKSHAKFEAYGIDSPLALLIYGPPGCGKTHLAREIAKELKLRLFLTRLDGLISSYLGSTSKNIRAVFEYVKSIPCILFLDEFDALAKLRDDTQELGEIKRVVNSFLQNLDSIGIETIVIAATNHHHLLDSAVWRRFNYRIFLDYPAAGLRETMWNEFLKPLEFSSHDIEILSDLSEGFSGSDIKEICLQLKRKSISDNRSVSLEDAFISLLRLSSGNGEKGRFLSTFRLPNNQEAVNKLRNRNSKLYSHAVIANLIGISKATAHRWCRNAGGDINAEQKQELG